MEIGSFDLELISIYVILIEIRIQGCHLQG